MSYVSRTLRNLRRIGLKEYGHQMQYMGDTKAGTLVGKDSFGNKYYENLEEELPRMSIRAPVLACLQLPSTVASNMLYSQCAPAGSTTSKRNMIQPT